MRVFKLCMFVMSSIYAQQMPMGNYKSIWEGTLQLPRDMRQEIANQSGGAISQFGEKIRLYQPIAKIEVQSGTIINKDMFPQLPLPFIEQLNTLNSKYSFSDGPNQLGIRIGAYNMAADYEEYSVSTAKAVITLVVGDNSQTIYKENFEITTVAIAPKSNHIIAYSGIQESRAGDKKYDIYTLDTATQKETMIGVMDSPVQRLQFCTDKLLYALANKRLYLFDLNDPGKVKMDQLFKDKQGVIIPIEDFVIDKIYPNYAIAIMNQGLYLLNLVSKTSKLLERLVPADSYKAAFFDNYIATLISNASKPSLLQIGSITIVGP